VTAKKINGSTAGGEEMLAYQGSGFSAGWRRSYRAGGLEIGGSAAAAWRRRGVINGWRWRKREKKKNLENQQR
jgi:hypothetical protein